MYAGVKHPNILKLDMAGQPGEWISIERAMTYYAKNMVAWELGDTVCTYRGGVSRLSGETSLLTTASIISVKGEMIRSVELSRDPLLDNESLFARDRQFCAYCGETFTAKQLSRDHVKPVCQGGEDVWVNVVTSCKGCNHRKAGRTPQQANMELLYIPYTPNRYEHFILINRRILADQMDYLKMKVDKKSRIFS